MTTVTRPASRSKTGPESYPDPFAALAVLETAHVRAMLARLDPKALTFPERLRIDAEATRAEEAFAAALAVNGASWERDGPKGRVRWELDRMGRPWIIGGGSGPGLPSATSESRPVATPDADPYAAAFEAYMQATAVFYKARRLGSQHSGLDRACALNSQRRKEFATLIQARPNGAWRGWTVTEGGRLYGPEGWSFTKEMARRAKVKGHEGGNGDGRDIDRVGVVHV